MMRPWLISLIGAVMVGGSIACGGRDEPGTAAETDGTSERAPDPTPAAVPTATVPASPCDWIPTDQVAVVGPLDGVPERIRNVEQPKPSDDGNACLFRLQAQPRLGGRVFCSKSPRRRGSSTSGPPA